MAGIDMTVEVCGMSGDGTIAAGGLLNEAVSGAGFFVMAFDSYPAEIRGFGRCVTRSRIGDEEMTALGDATHALISLDDEQSISRIPGLAENAMVFFDNRPPSYVSEGQTIAAHTAPGVRLFGMPFRDLAVAAAGTARGRNLTALGGFAAVAGMGREPFLQAIGKKFEAKGEKVLEANLNSFEAGFAFAAETFADRIDDALKTPTGESKPERVLLSGNAAIGAGAMDAGLRFYFGYPITPATPIMEYLAKALPKTGGRVTQMEDEIASIGAVLGSFYAGKRAMTATSGPGLALMTELITHGVMSETPAVIVNAQRGGPSTGLPTKTEQSDLQAAVFGGPGDSARIVIAPTNVTECYWHTLRSFRLAERYQTPVIVLTDFFLDNRVENVVMPKASPDEALDANVYPDAMLQGDYGRYEITASGISPRAIPGMAGTIFPATGLEHSERGVPDYTAKNHMAMNGKRHRKIQGALVDLPKPEAFFDGEPMEVGVIAWGSTFGSALEAVRRARAKGLKTGALKITALFPYHAEEIRDFMDRCGEVLIPELNFQGQLATLIGHLHRKEVARFNQTTGVPISPTDILHEIASLVNL
ncbi:MAG: 2-oxoacid:acceptor oxidoreductase subunit alpha [Deltaproteobacteria bacterium]|nr:2-oxoacid:acceptor oxidoreductase subunit alpha [Deltaproteobacteria bacterium]MBW1816604.1 2-oxoacid:acceptor oxidoreductase subunit alpha [Deltaproteobacteria bacterium]